MNKDLEDPRYQRLIQLAKERREEMIWDGDSTVGPDGTELRMSGVEAPERDHIGVPAEPLSDEAIQFLKELKAESGGAQREVHGKGFYGRDLGILRGDDGRDLNAELVKTGTVHRPRYGDDYAEEYEIAQRRLRTDMGDMVTDPTTRRRMEQVRAAQDEAFQRREAGEFLRVPKYSTYDGDNRGTFKKSFHRGLDQSQAMIYAAGEALGQLFGADLIEEWGAEGVERNLREAALSPPEIQSYEDVDSLADAGTYILEAIGEQAPQLLVDLGFAVGSGGVSLGVSVARRAALAKALQRSVGPQKFGQLRKLAQMRKRTMSDAGTAAKYGAVAGIYSQTTGEAQLELREQGIEAPATALAVGGLNAAVEFKALQFAFAPVFKKLAKQGATDRVTIASALKAAGKHAGVSMPAEALTEMTQTFTSKMAAQLHGGEYAFTDEAIKEYIDAGLKGGIVGGTMGGGAALMGQSRRAMGDAYLDRIIEANRELDGGTEDVGQTGSQTETTPETEESSGDTQSEQSPVQDAGGSDTQSTETISASKPVKSL